MRLFFAVLPPPEVVEAVVSVQSHLRAEIGDDGIRWVAPEHFHYTLKFLGDTLEERLPAAREAAQTVAVQIAPFPVTVAHLGGLPKTHFPQVIYAFVDVFSSDSFPQLQRLAESLNGALAARGFAAEKYPLFPHLTLARIKSSVGSKAARTLFRARSEPLVKHEPDMTINWGEQIRVDKIGVFDVQSFVLIESELRPSGPVYTVLETFPLTGV